MDISDNFFSKDRVVWSTTERKNTTYQSRFYHKNIYSEDLPKKEKINQLESTFITFFWEILI